MYLRSSFASLILCCAAVTAFAQSPPAPTCADLHLVPAVRECTGTVYTIAVVRVDSDPKNYQDEAVYFAAKDLAESLKDAGVKFGPKGTPIEFILVDNQKAKEILAKKNLSLDAAMRDEGYILTDTGDGAIAVIAQTSTGFFYGVQTLKQLVRPVRYSVDGNEEYFPNLQDCTIRDWPAMPHRGISDDWSRGPIPNMDFLKREIRTLAAYKINIFSPYFEHTFAYASSPVAAFPGGAMTPDEARELVEYAAKYHISILPEQEAFGHLHKVLKFEQFTSLGETPHGTLLAPGDPATQPLIGGWFAELAKVFPGPWVHIGADETADLGLGRTHDLVKQQGLGAVYLDFLRQIHSTLAPNHKQLLFWGDIAVNSPDLVATLPKDMIAVPWEYDAKPDFTSLILPFKNAGLETWVAPGVNNWNRIYPNNNEALGNIRAFVRDGQKLGSTGVLNTVWNDDGEGIFDENWYGVLFGAAAGWQSGESSEEAFAGSFGQAFHRDATGKINQAQRELMAAHDVFKKAGLDDAEDAYFWIDPFSPEGLQVAKKLRPALADLRLHSERAITLVAEARLAAKLENAEALDAMELGARRIDFVGLKFQCADEAVALYAQAQALAPDKTRWNDVSGMLWTISSNEGKFQDIGSGYALLGGLFRQAWLRDNRPYWLENDMARYDAATQLWLSRGNKWNAVLLQWDETHTLPTEEQAGFPSGAGK
jgi:hypothetical protein